jgi:hypothetical protein
MTSGGEFTLYLRVWLCWFAPVAIVAWVEVVR